MSLIITLVIIWLIVKLLKKVLGLNSIFDLLKKGTRSNINSKIDELQKGIGNATGNIQKKMTQAGQQIESTLNGASQLTSQTTQQTAAKPAENESKPAESKPKEKVVLKISAPTGKADGVEYVDLGLSVMWGYCNMGAKEPQEVGSYYGWGETEPKERYTKENYVQRGDVCEQKLGSKWHLPGNEIYELLEKCKFYEGEYKGKEGVKVVGPNGNSIFLPFGTSAKDDVDPLMASFFNLSADYWTRLSWDTEKYPEMSDKAASFLYLTGSKKLGIKPKITDTERYEGLNIRPIYTGVETDTSTAGNSAGRSNASQAPFGTFGNNAKNIVSGAKIAKLGGNQAKAVFSLAYTMCRQSGKDDMLNPVMTSFFGPTWCKESKTDAFFDLNKAADLIEGLPDAKKRYVSATLLCIAAWDGKIEGNENKFWEATRKRCGLPNMTVKEAIELFKSLS